MNLNVVDMHSFLEMLNDQSFLLKKGNRMWALTTHQSSSSGAGGSLAECPKCFMKICNESECMQYWQYCSKCGERSCVEW